MFLFETTSNNVFIQQFWVLDKKNEDTYIPCNQLNIFFSCTTLFCVIQRGLMCHYTRRRSEDSIVELVPSHLWIPETEFRVLD